MSLTELERSFINQYQGGFPVMEQPFRMVAADLGAGTGLFTEPMANRAGRVYAIDLFSHFVDLIVESPWARQLGNVVGVVYQ